MASTHKHIRSSTADKRPTTAIADGQIALNTNVSSPGLFFKDSTGATIIKVGPVHVGTTAPNAVPAAGGSSGNSAGEVWLDTSLTPPGVKIWNGSAWVNATPTGSTTAQGLLELATDAETQAGSDAARAVTPASLQSKISDSTSTTSSTTIASSTAVKAAYDLANAAVPTSGGTVTGNLEIGSTGSLSFEGSTIDGFETSIAITDPTADRVITLPDTTGTVVTTGDSGTVTSAMIANGTIVDGDISATAEIAVSKLADGAARQLLQTDAAGTGVEWTSNVDIPGTLDVTGVATFDSTAAHPSGSAAAPTITFTGDPNTGLYSPGADQLAISTGGTGRLFVDSAGVVRIGAPAGTSRTFSIKQANTWGLSIDASADDSTLLVGEVSGEFRVSASFATTGSYKPITLRTSDLERLRITSDGKVGIGTSAPNADAQLHVQGALFTPTAFYLGETTCGILPISTTGNTNGFRFFTQNGEKVRIDTAGRLGIGTTSPAQLFHLAANNCNLYLQPVSNAEARIQAEGGTAGTGTAITFHNYNGFANGERARIDSFGRLLVGTSTARATFFNSTASAGIQLEAAGDISAINRRLSVVYGDSGPFGPYIILGKHRSDSIGGNTVVQSGDEMGGLTFQGSDGSEFVEAARIQAFVDGTPGANDMPGRLVFSTTADGTSSPTERMRISNDGSFSFDGAIQLSNIGNANGFGIYGSTRNFYVASTGSNVFSRRSTDGSVIIFRRDTADIGSISVTTTATAYNTSSDYRLKENVIAVTDGIFRLQQLKPSRFNFIADPGRTVDGFLAHEVQTVVPEAIIGEKDAVDDDGNPIYQGIDQSKLVPLLTAALQEAVARIEALEAKVAALEGA